jgi:hypothetical protein
VIPAVVLKWAMVMTAKDLDSAKETVRDWVMAMG